jgi:hypothetical protein
MLEAQLPAGTPKSRIAFYLSSPGFPVQNTNDADLIVAIVHHVDTDTLRPATAQVIFSLTKATTSSPTILPWRRILSSIGNLLCDVLWEFTLLARLACYALKSTLRRCRACAE